MNVESAVAGAEFSGNLSDRGYAVLPEPQVVQLASYDVVMDDDWEIACTGGLAPDDDVVTVFKQLLRERHGTVLNVQHYPSESDVAPKDGQRSRVSLRLAPLDVEIGGTTQRDTTDLVTQSYKLCLTPRRIMVTAPSRTGLLYGLMTVLQLMKPSDGRLLLPGGTIIDWPDLGRRYIFWDDSKHLDTPDTLKAALRQAAFYKINGFVLKLDSHFVYRSAPAAVGPHALSSEQLQELTDYGLRHHVKVIPYVDAPGHLAWLLKHPEYAHLREFPECNYQLCTTDPDACRLLEGVLQDLLDANRGVDYFVLSTDEPYYVGLGRSAERTTELGSVGKVLAEFVTRLADYLRQQGRTVQIWGEYPVERQDVPSLPSHLVNGVDSEDGAYNLAYARNGNRQLIYVSTQGILANFPNYYELPVAGRQPAHPDEGSSLAQLYQRVSVNPIKSQDNIEGVFVAAWADSGLHPETFWLGFVCSTSWAWHPGTPTPSDAVQRFAGIFYGPSAIDIDQCYKLLSHEAQFFEQSWDWRPSNARTLLFGDSYEIFPDGKAAIDQYLSLPPIPEETTLKLSESWSRMNQSRLHGARVFRNSNEQLIDLLSANQRVIEYNHHNIEVFLAIARLLGQNLALLQDFGRISDVLAHAERCAGQGSASEAVAAIDYALEIAQGIKRDRNEALHDAIDVWYKTWLPKEPEANGRVYLHVFDDVKDPPPDRTTDMSYLIYRQLLLPLDDWFDKVQAVRNRYAQANDLAVVNRALHWRCYGRDTGTNSSVGAKEVCSLPTGLGHSDGVDAR